MKTALIASVPETVPFFSLAFGSSFRLLPCFSLPEAREKLCQDIDLILCDVRFDLFHMSNLLSEVRSNPIKQHVAFVVVDAADSPPFIAKNEAALGKELGANGFIEANAWRRELGDNAAAERLRICIGGLMVFGKDKFWAIGEIKDGYRYCRT